MVKSLKSFGAFIAESHFAWLLIAAGIVGGVASLLLGQQVQEAWFALTNFGIMGGYLYVVIFVAPYFKVDNDTKLAAAVFFATCATTHLELAMHTLVTDNGFDLDDLTSVHMMVIHSVQVIAIWKFVLGLRKAAILDRQRLKELVQRENVMDEWEVEHSAR